MNDKLTNAIVEHILDNLGITAKQPTPITSDAFLTNHKIPYEYEETSEEAKVWVSEASINGSKITIAYTTFNVEGGYSEDIVIVDIKDCPLYGCYFMRDTNEYDNTEMPYTEALIAFSIKNDKKSEISWLKASDHIRATFLAGMEHIKDLMASFAKPKNSDDIFKALMSFTKYVDQLQE